MKWCFERKVHFISDEIYALSVFRDEFAVTPFVSAYTLAHTHPDFEPSGQRVGDSPQTRLTVPPPLTDLQTYLHILWGASKDWGLNGFRIGVLQTGNAELRAVMAQMSYFFAVPSGVDVGVCECPAEWYL